MSLVINTNLGAINGQRNLNSLQSGDVNAGLTFNQGIAYGKTWEYDLNSHFTSPNLLTYTVTNNATLPSWMSLNNGVITGSPSSKEFGDTLPIQVIATDSVTGAGASADFNVSVLNFDAGNLFTGTTDNNTFVGIGNNNTVSYADSSIPIMASLVNGNAIGDSSDTLKNIENIIGSNYSDTLIGDVNTKVLAGGLGDDNYVVNNSNTKIIESSNGGTDNVSSSVSYTLPTYVENLTLTGSDNINATGNNEANILIGNSVNNIIDGRSGADTMQGGAGNDTYIVDNVHDVIYEDSFHGGSGIDSVISSVTYTLPSDVENLTLTGRSAINGTGNNLDNVIIGNAGNNKLSGMDGNDKIFGGAGNDKLIGGTGDDTLIGGAGADTLTGGSGYDVYVYNAASDSKLGSVDNIIGEFNDSAADTIQLASTLNSLVVIPTQNSDVTSFGLNTTILNSLLNSTIGTAANKFTTGKVNVAILTTTDSKTFFAIDINGDGTFTADDMLINLSGSILTSVTPSTFKLTSTSLPYIVLTASATSVNEGSSVTYTVTSNTSAPSGGLSIPYTLSGTGITTGDFSGISSLTGTINIAAGATTGTLSLNIAADNTTEGSETLVMTLGTVVGANVGNGSVTTTINDTSTTSPLSFAMTGSTSVIEGNNATFTVTLSAAQTTTTTVNYIITNIGTASSADYSSPSVTGSGVSAVASTVAPLGLITFAPGSTMATITVPVLSDAFVETGEGITLSLSNPSLGTIVPNAGSVTASFVDAALPLLSLTESATSVNEGSTVVYSVTSNTPAPSGLSIPYTLSGTGITTGDFSNISSLAGTINIAAGATTGTLSLNIAADNTTEGSETLAMTLGTVAGANVGNGSVTTTINDTSIATASSPITTVVNATTNLVQATAATVNTFVITPGNYSATINGFVAGDKLIFFPGAAITVVPDTNQTDGIQQITAANPATGEISTITLTGLTFAQDGGVFNVPSFNTVFGTDSIITPITPPSSLSSITLSLDATSDTGSSSTDNITKVNKPTITLSSLNGIAMTAGQQIVLVDATNPSSMPTLAFYIVQPSDLSSGVWSAGVKTIAVGSTPVNSSLLDGVHNLKAFIASSDGGSGGSSTGSLAVTIDTVAPTNQDAVLTSSTSQTSDKTVTIYSSDDATNEVWLAPAGTTTFIAGTTMTKAISGTATSILAPATAGTYKLFVIDSAGNISNASVADLTVTAPTPSLSLAASSISVDEGLTVTYTVTSDVSAPSSGLSIPYTLSGTGITTGDFSNISSLTGTINIAAGATTGVLTLNIAADNTTEGSEALTVTLGTVTGVNIGNSSVTTTINDTSIAVSQNQAPTFAIRGIAATSLTNGNSTSSDARSYTMGVQPDGKILLGGGVTNHPGFEEAIALVRYNSDGSLDTSFNTNGIVETVVTPQESFAEAHATIVQNDGKILLCGYSPVDLTVVRYNTDGSLDTGFGNAGIAGNISSSDHYSGQSIALQNDGKILVGGTQSSNMSTSSNFVVARYNSNGTLDTGFGNLGLIKTNFDTYDNGEFIAIQPNTGGRILLGGSSGGKSTVVAYGSTGAIDTSFGNSGKLTTDLNDSYPGNKFIVQSDGKIIIGGTSSDGKFKIERYSADGTTLDNSFGNTGNIISSGYESYSVMALQGDGKILVASLSNNTVILERYNTDGTLDNSFGNHGVVTNDSISFVGSIFIKNDGEILLGSNTWQGQSQYFTLVRYNSDGSLDNTFALNNGLSSLNPNSNFQLEGGSATLLDGDVQIYDAELAGLNNYNGASISLSRQNASDSNDLFSVTGGIKTSSQSSGVWFWQGNGNIGDGGVYVDSTNVGTYSGGTGSLVITFNQNATQVLVNQVLSSITYRNLSLSSASSPTIASQSATISWTFSDGNTGSQGSGGTKTVTATENVSIYDIDLTANMATMGSINVGDFALGYIGNNMPGNQTPDQDWFKVHLLANESYQIDLEGAATGKGTLAHTQLAGIYDSASLQINPASPTPLTGTIVGNQSGSASNANLNFTPTTEGDYFISVAGVDPTTDTGSYQLSVIDLIGLAGTAMLAQANQSGQSVMTLLR